MAPGQAWALSVPPHAVGAPSGSLVSPMSLLSEAESRNWVASFSYQLLGGPGYAQDILLTSLDDSV
jgi:hypothetical protein